MKRMWSKNEIARQNKDITTLVDKDGHERFIEENITLPSLPDGFTIPYAKWSLSGTHLMIVVCFAIASGSSSTGVKDIPINLPQWVKDKITTVFGVYVENKGSQQISDSNSASVGTMFSNISKQGGNILLNYYVGDATTDEGYIRLAYDLLIDNE